MEKQQRAAAYLDGAQSEGPLPLDTMLLIMRRALERGDEATALDAASRAAGYCHPHLTSTQIAMESTNTHWVMSDAPMTAEQWCERYGIAHEGSDGVSKGNGQAG